MIYFYLPHLQVNILLLQVRQDLPVARPDQEREEKDEGEKTHPEPCLRRNLKSNNLCLLVV